MRFVTDVVIHAKPGSDGDDRAIVVEVPHGLVVALADGVGGRSGGARAAQAVVDAVQASASTLRDAADCAQLLDELDNDRARIGPGCTTAIVLVVTPVGIVGASAGDSIAWVVRGDAIAELTEHQHAKPFLGDGAAIVGIAAPPLGDATLLVASDGLSRYADRAAIATHASRDCDALVNLVRQRYSALPDDISVILVRAAS